jgi:hypothetical protein
MMLFNAQDLTRHLRQRGLVEEFIKDQLLQHLLAQVELPQQQQDQLWADFLRQNALEQPEALQAFLAAKHLDQDLLREQVIRPHRLIQFREAMWGPLVNSLYLQRKDEFDIITFTMVRSRDYNVMQEVYFRLKDGEETWQAICRQLNPDQPETPVVYGPAYRAQFSRELVDHLYGCGIGVISPATLIGGWTVVTRLERIQPSALDDAIRAILLKDRFDAWFEEQCSTALQTLRFTDQGLESEFPLSVGVALADRDPDPAA